MPRSAERADGDVMDTPSPDRLPVGGLLALAMTGFIAIMTETLPAGLLPQIGHSLGVSESSAGQLVTLYAVGTVAASIPLTAATQGWRRRPVLLSAIAGFLVFNTITAVSKDYALTLTARFFAGVASGLSWGIVAGYARRMVTDALKGRALAIAMVGTPIALSLGTPAGSFLGSAVGWQSTFMIMSLLTIGLIGWVFCKVPDFPGQSASRRITISSVFTTPGVRPVLFVIFAWMLAHNILYTYIAPFARLSGLGTSVDKLLLDFGLAAMAGIWAVGLLVDRHLRKLVLVSLTGFAAAAILLGAGCRMPLAVYLAIAAWGLTFGGAATLLQTASADAAGNGADIAQAMVTTVWNAAIAGGGIFGALLLGWLGAASFPWAILGILGIALIVAWQARAHGFTPPQRSAP